MKPWEHDHAFGQDAKKPGEIRTLIVVVLTALTMIVEISAGIVYGSMALLADGLHMASHATALAIAMFAYVYARRYAHDQAFCFGTGKVNSLAGFAGAILLALFSIMMAWESFHRLFEPVHIDFTQAIVVALLGLIVNGVSVFILGHAGIAEHSHDHDEHGHDEHRHDELGEHRHGSEDDHHRHAHEHDHNLRSAYLHVLADTLTSVLAIFALLAGKYVGWEWLDPVMGVVGAVLVARWSLGLLRTTSHVLLDRQGPEQIREAIREHVRRRGDEVADLHLWAVAAGSYALILAVVSEDPQAASVYRRSLPEIAPVAHLTVEVWSRSESAGDDKADVEDGASAESPHDR